MRTWGRLLAWAGLMAVLGLLPLVVGWSNLPDPLAIHWGIGGSPDNAWPKNAAALLPISMVAIGLFTTSLFRIESKPTAEVFAMVGLMGGLGFSLMASVVYLNWDAPTLAGGRGIHMVATRRRPGDRCAGSLDRIRDGYPPVSAP